MVMNMRVKLCYVPQDLQVDYFYWEQDEHQLVVNLKQRFQPWARRQGLSGITLYLQCHVKIFIFFWQLTQESQYGILLLNRFNDSE